MQAVQVSMGIFWRLMRLLSDGAWNPTMVSFAFAEPKNTLVYKRFFNVTVLFGADENNIIFHTEDLRIPLPRHDEYLLKVLRRYAETLQISRRRNLKDEVKDLLRKNLLSGKTGIEHVARFFHSSGEPFKEIDSTGHQLQGTLTWSTYGDRAGSTAKF